MAPSFSGSSKNPLAMVVYKPLAAAAAASRNKRLRQEEEEASTSTSSSANPATLLLLHAAPASRPLGDYSSEPISAVPMSAVAPELPPPVVGKVKEEPPCLRKHFLEDLGLRANLPVRFVDSKNLTDTDLDPHQNRFRIPNGGIDRLRSLLTPGELHAANLLAVPRKPPKKKQRTEQLQNGADGDNKQIKKPKARGKVHGGLRVELVDLAGGTKKLLLSRWDSSHAIVVKGEGYLDFVRRCGFVENEPVEIWAFVQRPFRLFGNDIYNGSLLHLLIVRKNQQPTRCRCCPQPLLLPHAADKPPIVNSS